MNNEELILAWVEENPGRNAIELVVGVMQLPGFSQEGPRIPELLQNLVEDARLVEVEYVVPSMNYRIKSRFFPIGTVINVKNAQKLH